LQEAGHDDLIDFKKAWGKKPLHHTLVFSAACRVTSKIKYQKAASILGVGQPLSFPS
jgi:hypothetical protein